MNEGCEVTLAVYDLSHGMAKQLSAQFLGPGYELEMIPHTAIRCYQREWFFGGGIQSVDPMQFQLSTGMTPVQILTLGRTTRSLVEFQTWCQQEQQYPNGGFTATSYDLLQCNCNHFSHAAALDGLKLSQGVPQWILDVPQRFLSSPMGQLVRPMLEQMQITGQSPVTATSTSISMPNNTKSPINPWTTGKSKASPKEASQSPSQVPTPVLDSFHKPLVSKDTGSIPLVIRKLSSKTQGKGEREDEDSSQKKLSILGTLLQQTLVAPGGISPITAALEDFQSEADEINSALTVLWDLVVSQDATSPGSSNLTFALMLLRLVVLVIPTIETMIPSTLSSSAEAVYSTVLYDILKWMQQQLILASDDDDGGCADANKDGDDREALLDKNPVARSMAWCVLSNLVSAIVTADSVVEGMPKPEPDQQKSLVDNQQLIDSAIRDMTVSNCQVRQAATCFLYNLALYKIGRTQLVQVNLPQSTPEEKEEVDGIILQDDLLLSILCAVVEEFSLIQLITKNAGTDQDSKGGIQYDPTTCLRRLAVIGRILVPLSTETRSQYGCNGAVRQFLLDLGLDQLLKDHVATASYKSSNTDRQEQEDAEQCRRLATELFMLLQATT